MKARQRRPRAPKPETLSMDWFTETLEDLSLQEDPRGCHSNLQEHQEAEQSCMENLGFSHIINPHQFLNRWGTSEILSGLDAMVGQELQGNAIRRPAGWLWSYLEDKTDTLEPGGYPARSSEVINSIVHQLKRRGFSHPGYLVMTYSLEIILDAVNAVEGMVGRGIEVNDVPGLVTLWLENSGEESREGEGTMKREILTPAELALLGLISRGLSNKEIAQELNISDYSVTNRITSILSKLGANNRAHAVVIALRRGIIDLPEGINGQSKS